MLPVNESVTGDRQQLPAVFIVKGAGAVGKLHTCGRGAHTCTEGTRTGVKPAGQITRLQQGDKTLNTRVVSSEPALLCDR